MHNQKTILGTLAALGMCVFIAVLFGCATPPPSDSAVTPQPEATEAIVAPSLSEPSTDDAPPATAPQPEAAETIAAPSPDTPPDVPPPDTPAADDAPPATAPQPEAAEAIAAPPPDTPSDVPPDTPSADDAPPATAPQPEAAETTAAPSPDTPSESPPDTPSASVADEAAPADRPIGELPTPSQAAPVTALPPDTPPDTPPDVPSADRAPPPDAPPFDAQPADVPQPVELLPPPAVPPVVAPQSVIVPETVEIVPTQTPKFASPIDPITAVAGEPFRVILTDPTWLYIGEEPTDSAVNFLGRIIEPMRSIFRLRIDRIGRYRLLFQNQDLIAGVVETRPVIVRVVEQGSAQARQRDELPLPDEPLEQAEQSDAPDQIEQTLFDNGPQARDRLAARAFDEGRYVDALEYWNANLDEDEQYAASARRGRAQTLYLLGEERINSGDNSAAIELFESLIADFPAAANIDAVYFWLGRIYETDAENRNLRRALDYYRVVIDRYPISNYWEPATLRSEFLLRHFFDIR